jgi:Ca2+-binding RTX toxin-like protein
MHDREGSNDDDEHDPEGVTLLSDDGTRLLLEGVAAEALGADSFVWARPERPVFGTAGADTLDGGPGDDVAFGGAGDDVFRVSGGSDRFDGSTGSDWLHAPKTKAVKIDLSLTGPQPVPGGQVALRSVENLLGSTAGDTLLGNAAGNRLLGQGGYDLIDGRGGMDKLVGGKGRDRLYGGQDRVRDTFVFETI